MAHHPEKIDALLFDLGGVLINVDFGNAFRVWERYCDVKATILQSRFSVDPYYQRHERGEIDAREYFQSLRVSLGINLSDAEFTEGWNAILGEEIRATTALLEQLKKHHPLFLFSNSNALHQRCWTMKFAPMLNQFQTLFVSSEIGKRKPDVEAFLHVSEKIGAAPERILFFDDTTENIEGAQCAGMAAVHVTAADSVADAVARILHIG